MCIILDVRCIATILFPFSHSICMDNKLVALVFSFFCHPFPTATMCWTSMKKKELHASRGILHYILVFYVSAIIFGKEKESFVETNIQFKYMQKQGKKRRSRESKHFGILSLDVLLFLFLISFWLIQVEPDGFCICQLATVTINSHLILKCWLTHS